MLLHEEFLNDLKWSIEETNKKNTFTPSKSYKPSSMNCIRNMYYQMVGATPNVDNMKYYSVNICNSGTDIHARTQQQIMEMFDNGIDCHYVNVEEYIKQKRLDDNLIVIGKNGEAETKLHSNKYSMNFACDGIIYYKGIPFILEIKTETMRKWVSRFGVDPSHYNQATCYSLNLNIDNVLFLYINRDTLEMKAFTFEVTPIMKENIINLINTCNYYVENNILPPKPIDIDSKNCRYCKYKNLCKNSS